MAYTPTEQQRLDIDNCADNLPDNSSIWGSGWYCDEGYRANTADDGGTPRTSCILIDDGDDTSGSQDQNRQQTTTSFGLGNVRSFYGPSIIDRDFGWEKFTGGNRPGDGYYRFPGGNKFPLDTNDGPIIEDKFRANNGLYWSWDEDKNDIVYVFNPPINLTDRKIHGGQPLTDEDGYSNINTSSAGGEQGREYSTTTSNEQGEQEGTYNIAAKVTLGIKQTMLATVDNGSAHHNEPASSTYEIRIGGNNNVMHYYTPGYRHADGKHWVEAVTHQKPEGFRLYVESMIEKDKYFYDHAFKLTTPLETEDTPSAMGSPMGFYKITPIYNFYVSEKYESSDDDNNSELNLPNAYMELLTNGGSFREKLFEDWDLDDYISNFESEKIPYIFGTKVSATSNVASEISEAGSKSKAAANKFTNVLVSYKFIQNLKNYYEKKDEVPLYMDFEFSTDTNTGLTNILKDSDMACALMKDMIRDEEVTEPDSEDSNADDDRLLEDKSYIEFLSDITSDSTTDASGTAAHIRRSIDITEWYNHATPRNPIGIDGLEKAIFINTQDRPGSCDTHFWGIAAEPNFNSQTGGIAALAEIVDLMDVQDALRAELVSKTRTFKEVLEGKMAHSETVMYRIEKRDSDDNVIQSFYLPNSNDINIHRFIDSQVKYGKKYTYTVYAWQLVYGSKYKYTQINSNWENDAEGRPWAKVTVVHQPSVKIVEVPYIKYENKILDNPPMLPDINIVPYYKINNKIMINLNSGTGKAVLEPVAINSDEGLEIEDLMKSQNRLNDNMLEYKSYDDHIIRYRMYRLDKHPKKYSDFSEGVIKEVEAISSSAKSIVENILPNKKYWYTFRSVDAHSHFSYPTPVYQVELVDDGSSIYPLVNTVDFKDENNVLK